MASDNEDVDLDNDLLGLLVKLFFNKFIETFISNLTKIEIESLKLEDRLGRKAMNLFLTTTIWQKNNLLIIREQNLVLKKKQMASSVLRDQSKF